MVPSQSSESELTSPFKALSECSVPACITEHIENAQGYVTSFENSLLGDKENLKIIVFQSGKKVVSIPTFVM